MGRGFTHSEPKPTSCSKTLESTKDTEIMSAFKQHMTGREYGEEETADAFEHFKSGFEAGSFWKGQQA
jgi:hypothetical protein